ncbi:alginate export family protein [Phenylobacterium sp.]|uniref:alginate export family protein n=1 Tax=Phenylobacterium sp. TaxID=1871053 RepID=UPI002736D54F|nr:alginate export family protein [Phenylobacterium sp.]MDP3659616.1 alginate export family protein [Phenylobacterium sp.]
MKTRGIARCGALLAAMAWAGAAAAQAPAAEPPAEDGLGSEAAAEPAPLAEAAPAEAPAQTAATTISDAIAGGKLLLEVRGRYENVDQKNTPALSEDADAFTVRTRLGWETADWNGLRGLIEFEDVRQAGGEHFAVNVPGATTAPLNGANKAKYPLINDPDVTELNRLQLTWTPNAMLQMTAGRQRILIDDQRFVGNVGWRQDEQTFDAVRSDVAWGRFKATYAYLGHVNRILGEDRDWDSDSHLFNATWSPAESLRLQGFVYALEFGNSAANSSITKGVKASGKTWVGLYQLAYNATYARQSDYRSNTAAYDLDYLGVDVAGTFDIYTVKASWESLEGNGTRGFTTPLATTHAFQGWADAFVQPLGGNKGFVDGIEDLNLAFTARPRFRMAYLFNAELIVRYHDFDGQRTGADLGREWDAQLQAAITPKLSAALKYADFEREARVPLGAAAPPPSRTKVWLTLEYKL